MLDAAAPRQGALAAVAGLLAALLLALVAAARARGIHRPVTAVPRSRLARLPWELLLITAAAATYLRLRSSDAVTFVGNVAQINLLLVSFPLLLLAGAVLLAARVVTAATTSCGRSPSCATCTSEP